MKLIYTIIPNTYTNTNPNRLHIEAKSMELQQFFDCFRAVGRNCELTFDFLQHNRTLPCQEIIPKTGSVFSLFVFIDYFNPSTAANLLLTIHPLTQGPAIFCRSKWNRIWQQKQQQKNFPWSMSEKMLTLYSKYVIFSLLQALRIETHKRQCTVFITVPVPTEYCGCRPDQRKPF